MSNPAVLLVSFFTDRVIRTATDAEIAAAVRPAVYGAALCVRTAEGECYLAVMDSDTESLEAM